MVCTVVERRVCDVFSLVLQPPELNVYPCEKSTPGGKEMAAAYEVGKHGCQGRRQGGAEMIFTVNFCHIW